MKIDTYTKEAKKVAKTAIEQHGIKAVIAKTGATRSTVNRWKKGSATPDKKALEILKKMVGTTSAENGEWVHVTPKSIDDFRERNSITSWAALGRIIGVSPTSIRGWIKNGKIAAPDTQKKVKSVFDDTVDVMSDACVKTKGIFFRS